MMSIAGMEIFALSYLAGWVDMCLSSFFTALERPARSLVASFFGAIVFPCLFLGLLTPIWQLNGVWLTAVAASAASAVLAVFLALTLNMRLRTGNEA